MGPAAILRIVVEANTGQATSSLAKTQKALKSTAAESQSATSKIGKEAKKTGAQMVQLAKYGALAAVGVAAVSTKMAYDFETSMQKVRNLVGVSQKQVDEWAKSLLKMSGQVGIGPQELADTLYFVSSSGVKASKVLNTVRIAAEASAIGLGDASTVADALTSSMNAYAKSGLTARDATNVMVKTVKFGKLEADSLAKSIGRVIPVASQLNIPFSDVGASLAAMSLQGLDAAEATTALRAIFTSMIKPTAASEKALASVGLSAASVRDSLAKDGTLATLQMLSDKFHGNVESMGKIFPNVRALVGAFNLTGDSAKHNALIFKQMSANTDDLGKSWKEFQQTPAQKMRLAISSIQSLMVQLGQKILPVASKALSGFASILTNDKLTANEKFSKIFDKIAKGASKALTVAIPKLADAAASAAPKIAKGLVDGFLNASVWGKLVVGGFLLKKFGGFAALSGVGARMGTSLLAGLGGAAGATAIGAAVLAGVVAAKGIIDTGFTLSGEGMAKTLTDALSKQLDKTLGPALAKATNAKDVTGLLNLRKHLRDLFPTADALGIDPQVIHARVDAINKQIAMIGKPRAAVKQNMAQLRSGVFTSLHDILQVVQRNAGLIDVSFNKGSSEWRDAMAKNLEAAAVAMDVAMKTKAIPKTKENLTKVRGLLRNAHLFTGDDPLGIAKGFAQSWKKAGHISSAAMKDQISQLKKMPPQARQQAFDMMMQMGAGLAARKKIPVSELQDLRSKAAAQITGLKTEVVTSTFGLAKSVGLNFAAMSNIVGAALAITSGNVNNALGKFGVKAAAFVIKKVKPTLGWVGKQRGGPIFGGKPSGDSIPAMLERGEYVLNRKAVAAVGKPQLDAVNFGTAARFQKGGQAGVPSLKIAGTDGTLRDMAQGAVSEVTKAAQAYVQKHQPKGGMGGVPSVATGPIKQMAHQMVLAMWGKSEIPPFDALEMSEAGWNPRALNPSSGAAGLAQALPASKYPPGAWPYKGLESAKLQLGWMMGYIKDRYGSPSAAWGFHQANNSYREGGSVGDSGDPRFGVRHPISGSGRAGAPGSWAGKDRTLDRLLSVANYVNQKNLPYIWGGGHDDPATLGPGVDCSGAMSYLLQQSGWNIPTGVASGFQNIFEAGKGDKFTILSSADHVYGVLDGKAWGAMHSGSTVGYGWPYTYLGGYSERHPKLGVGGSGSSGPSAGQQKLHQGKQLRKHRDAVLAALEGKAKSAKTQVGRKSALWDVVNYFGNYGLFDKDSRKHTLEAVKKAASFANPLKGTPVLANLMGYLDDKVDLSGHKTLDHPLMDAITKARESGQKLGKHLRKPIFKHISLKGLDPKQQEILGGLDAKIADFNDQITRKTAMFQWPSSDSGVDFSDRETLQLIGTKAQNASAGLDQAGLYQRLLNTQQEKLRTLNATEAHLGDHMGTITDQIKAAKPATSPTHWKLKALENNRANTSSLLAKLRGQGTTLLGTGSDSIFGTIDTINTFGGSASSTASASPLDISGLRALLEAARFGVFDGTFAKGGKIGAGHWGIAGEAGPEPVFGPATVMPNSSVGASHVNVENHVYLDGLDVVVETLIDGKLRKRDRQALLAERAGR